MELKDSTGLFNSQEKYEDTIDSSLLFEKD